MKRQFLSVILLLFLTMATAFASRDISQPPLGNESSTNSAAFEKAKSAEAMQQSRTVTGVVVDSDGATLPGVSVVVRGTTVGTITDVDGRYSINVPDQGAVLVFNFIGMETQTVQVGSQSKIDIKMLSSTVGLDEVVAVGYGIQKKSDVTGALVRVDAKTLTARPVSNAVQALQGRATGVDVTSNERPGEMGKIYIRGMRSLSATNTPLYVVDGVPLSSGGIESLNPRDIESIDILKDASATAIYGSRGANGVVLVTTKSGKDGTVKFSYSGSVIIEEIKDKAPAMSASDYITWRRWAYYNSNPAAYPRGDQPTQASDATIFPASLDDTMSQANVMKGWVNGVWDDSQVTDTDWTKFVTQTGVTQEHTLSASGGSDKMNSYLSFGYLNNKGTQIGQAYERYNTKISTNIKPKKWFNLNATINAAWSEQDYGFSTTGSGSSSTPNSIYAAAKQIFRYALPYNEDGELIMYPGGQSTIYTIMDEWEKSEDKRQTFRALGSFSASLNFGEMAKVLDGLTFKSSFGPDFRQSRSGVFIDSSSAVRLGGTNYASWGVSRNLSYTFDNQLNYDKLFGIHKLGVTLLQSSSVYNSESASMSEVNVPKASYKWNNMGAVDITNAANKASMGTGLTESQLASYMGRFQYALKDRYLLTASGRYDGSSVLAEGNKWAFFPSCALGWRIEQESFMANQDIFQQLKLRLGFGTTGNSAVSPYQTIGEIQSYYVPFGGASNAMGYTTNEPYYGNLVQMANSELGWETTKQYNLGIDFNMLKGRIGGAIDLYSSHTTNLLMTMTIPTLTGFATTYANVGETKNRGVEVTLNLVPVKYADFTWDLGLNAAYQEDEIVSLQNGKSDMVDNGWFIGESISVYYGYKSNGLWQESDAEEMAKYNANGHTFQAGMVKPVDQPDENGVIDYKIDQNDRVILGNRLPRVTLGMTNFFRYKNLELGIMMNGRLKYMYSTGGEGQTGMTQQREINYWTPDNTNAEWQKPIYNQSGGDAYSALLGYQSASFIKIQNISLGYNLSDKICKSIGISNFKVYAQANNPGMIYSSIDWIDLDLSSSVYNRGVVFGVEVGF